jgi:hypothetical protein
MDNKKTIECIHTFLEKEFQMNYDAGLYEGRQEALCALVNMVPAAILRTNDKVDIDTSGFNKIKFDEDAEEARIYELKLAHHLTFGTYELKTIPYEKWNQYKNILIEVGKQNYNDKKGSLFQIESDGWFHQLLDEDGEPFQKIELSVKYLKKRYELLKDNKNNFIYCPNEGSQATWCMPIDVYINEHELINLLNEKDKIIEGKDKEIQRCLDTITKLENKLEKNDNK